MILNDSEPDSKQRYNLFLGFQATKRNKSTTDNYSGHLQGTFHTACAYNAVVMW